MNSTKIKKRASQALAGVLCLSFCGLQTGCDSMGTAAKSAGAGLLTAFAVKAGGGSNQQAAAAGAVVAIATYATLKVIERRKAEEAERQYALRKAMRTRSKSNTVYVAKRHGSKTELIKVNKSTKKVDDTVKVVDTKSIPKNDLVTVNFQKGEVIY